jgi:hypothetical protein
VKNLTLNTWFHAAFVYDHSIRKRFIYLNGVLDTSSNATQVLSVAPENISIDWALTSANMYYGGYMDHLTVSLRAKAACEVLQNATLSAYFPFDSSSSALTDSGPNFLKATGSGYNISTGHLNSAMFFNSVGSYAQIAGVRVLGQTSASSFTLPFSISVWLNPTVNNGSVLHVSSTNSGLGWCSDFLAFSQMGHIVAQLVTTATIGPILNTNTWTHVAMTFSPSNSLRLYIDGSLYTTATYNASSGSNTTMYVTLANPLNGNSTCATSYSVLCQYLGGIDELRIYSRELNSTDVCTLARQ